MSFEVTTLYSGGNAPSLAGQFDTFIRPMLVEHGAQNPTVYEALTGAFAGKLAISTRWESLGAIGRWLAEMPAQMSANPAIAAAASQYQMEFRAVGKLVASSGEADGAFMNVSRYSFSGAPVGLDHGAQLAVDAGGNGARILNLVSAGEMSGQIAGCIYCDDLDRVDAMLEKAATDSQFIENAQASGAQLQSRTTFRRL